MLLADLFECTVLVPGGRDDGFGGSMFSFPHLPSAMNHNGPYCNREHFAVAKTLKYSDRGFLQVFLP